MDKEKMAQLEDALLQLGGDVRWHVITKSSARHRGKYAIEFSPTKQTSWQSVVFVCNQIGVSVPDNMIIEKIEDTTRFSGFCSVTLTYGFIS